MASSSTSSIHKSFKYDVFLSFRGEDTRKNFVDHLYSALQHKSIYTYKDDERIKKGKRISDELIRAIEDSRIYIIIFSKTYASSSWCLDELVKIMECQKTPEHTAYPVFYDVEPTEVRKQSGFVGEAFARHVKEAAAGKWKAAMKEASDMAGWELKNTFDGHEAKFIKKIVEEISLELHFIDPSIDGKLVGMKTRVKNVVSSLQTSINDVRIIGINGMGGAGKTTLARSVFDHISIWFDGSSFVEKVRENASLKGLNILQEQVLSDVLTDQEIKVSGVYDGKNKMRKRLCSRKVLVVLDDVDHIDQLEALAGERTWFKPGSRIIVTTRDEQVLVAHRVNFTHDVNLFEDEEAICLFSRYAFGTETPIRGYKELSEQVVHYAAGLPLTIKVLGSFLCGKNDLEWKDALERLKTIPLKETLEKLELSYNGLEEDYKEIFLDVACILKGWDKKLAIEALESCGFHARNGLRVLEQKSLITVSDDGNLGMHDHIEEMGKNIVRRLHPNEPYRHSRLWIKGEIEYILANDLGTEAIRCITLWNTKVHPTIVMKGLGSMKELRFLNVRDHMSFMLPKSSETGQDIPDEVSQYIGYGLRFLSWPHYPFKSLPKNFQADNLVRLEMPYSSIVQLWEGQERKVLNKLRIIDLSNSKLRTLDLRLIPNLETLNLDGCDDFEELDMHFGCQKLRVLDPGLTSNLKTLSLANCEELDLPAEYMMLKYVYLSGCKLRTLDLARAPNLYMLVLKNCKDLVELHMPVESPKLNLLVLSNCKVRTLDLPRAPYLEMLGVMNCMNLVELHMPVKSPMLEILELKNCMNLVELHMPAKIPKLDSIYISNCKLRTLDLAQTPNFRLVTLKNCKNLLELHMPVESLKLNVLEISNCKLRTLDLAWAPNLNMLELKNCKDLVELRMPVESAKLKFLEIINCKLRTLRLEQTPDLEKLTLDNCMNLVELHIPVESLKLESLYLSRIQLRTLDLRSSPNLRELSLIDCYHLADIQAPVGCLTKLVNFDLSGCIRFDHFSVFKSSATVGSLAELYLAAESLDICQLHPDNNLPKLRFDCFYEAYLPSSNGNLEKLISLGMCACTNLERFSGGICGLQGLRKLTLKGSIPEAPKDLGQLECLEELILSCTEQIRYLPDSICMLKHLKSLKLYDCLRLVHLPEDLGRLKCLEELHLIECRFLQDIPNSICEMKSLKYLHLPHCIRVQKLPEKIGRLKCLKELNIEGTGIAQLPNSIFGLKGLRIIGSR